MDIATQNLDTNFEKWASIDGYLNYQVSWWGRVLNTKTGRILKPQTSTPGYLQVGLYKNGKGKIYYIHQLVAREWVRNPENKRCVDHADGCKTNNHHENLRYATFSENSRNQTKTSKPTSSIYKGVNYHKRADMWEARIRTPGKRIHLGYFTSEREAAKVYNAAAVLHHTNFAKINDLD